MSVGTGLGLAAVIGGGLGAAGSITSGILGSKAAGNAADEQATAEQNALSEQEKIFGEQQANAQPYLDAGKSGLSALMSALQSGKFGAGSGPTAPGQFVAPTLEQAQQTPGYQFTAQQGTKGILEGAGAAGGAISGGTLKALDSFNTGLADSTYQNIYGNALSSYGANLQDYQAQLQGQAQQFAQLLAPAQLGENAVSSINNTATQQSQNIGQVMQNIGSTQAAGTVGSTNAITGAIGSGTGSISQSLLLPQYLKLLSGSGGAPLTDAQLLGSFNGAPPIASGVGPG